MINTRKRSSTQTVLPRPYGHHACIVVPFGIETTRRTRRTPSLQLARISVSTLQVIQAPSTPNNGTQVPSVTPGVNTATPSYAAAAAAASLPPKTATTEITNPYANGTNGPTASKLANTDPLPTTTDATNTAAATDPATATAETATDTTATAATATVTTATGLDADGFQLIRNNPTGKRKLTPPSKGSRHEVRLKYKINIPPKEMLAADQQNHSCFDYVLSTFAELYRKYQADDKGVYLMPWKSGSTIPVIAVVKDLPRTKAGLDPYLQGFRHPSWGNYAKQKNELSWFNCRWGYKTDVMNFPFNGNHKNWFEENKHGAIFLLRPRF